MKAAFSSTAKAFAITLLLGSAVSVTFARRHRATAGRDAPLDTGLTETTRARFAPLLFAAGFDVACRTSLCTIETTFPSLSAFRDFAETAFQGRDPIWPGTFTLANAQASLGARRASDAPWRAVLLLGDRRRSRSGPGDKVVSSAVRITPATEGHPDRPSDEKLWSVRRADGAPEETMQNVSPSQYRQLLIPLRARNNLDAEPSGPRDPSWHAFVAVGGPDLARQPTRCALEQLDTSHPSGAVLVGELRPADLRRVLRHPRWNHRAHPAGRDRVGRDLRALLRPAAGLDREGRVAHLGRAFPARYAARAGTLRRQHRAMSGDRLVRS